MKRVTAAVASLSLLAGTVAASVAPAGAAPAPDVLDVVSVGGTSSSASAVSILPLLGSGTTGTPIALPTAAGGGNQPLTLSGSAGSEGQLSLSGDGRYLTLAGYAAAPGTGSVSSTSSASVPRVVGRVDASGNVDTSTVLGSDAFTGNNVRAATTADGTRFWITGANGSATKATGGVLTAALGAGAATSVSTAVGSGRTLGVVSGNLYLGTDKKPNVGVSRVGTGLPANTGQNLTTLAGPADPYGFALVTQGSGTSPDTLYVADGTSGGITKYVLTGSAWQAKGTIGGGTALFGLAARTENGGVQLYATTLDGKKVVSAFDPSGTGAASGSLATVSTAAAGTVYKGVAFGPAGQPAPGPAPVLTTDDTVLGAVVGDAGNGTLGVSLGDADSAVDVGALAVTASSSNAAVAPTSNVTVTGSGTRRTVAVTPTGVGYSTITLTATDAYGRSGSTSFTYGASAAANNATSRWLTGAADSSSAVDVGDGYVVVADDSTNVLRLYRSDRTGGPVRTWDIGARFGLSPTKGSDSMDLEAGARIGDTVWWTGSMGNSSDDGALRPNRSTLFATKLTGSGAGTDLTVVGSPYKGLRDDLIGWDQGNGNALGLAESAAAGHLTKTVDGFNVEGMEFTGDGSGAGYLGFRAPLERVDDRKLALVVPVTNLASLTDGGAHAAFGKPLLWNLGGLSVRELRRNAHGQYLVLAGSYAAANPTYRLYTWNGDPAAQPVAATTTVPAPLGGWESIVSIPDPITDGAAVSLVEDDGSVDFYGDGASTEAKSLPLGLRKSRVDTVTLTLPSQSIAFTTAPPVPATYGGTYRVAATGGASGQPVTFAPAAGDSCTVGDPIAGTDASGNGTGAATVTLGDVGSCTITASQAGGTGYQSATSVPQSFSVDPATPTITWPTPGDIGYGTPVTSDQLDATANVAGSFAYDVPSGTVLDAGDHTLDVTFTPDDARRYTAASASVVLHVAQAAQLIHFAALPDRTFGDSPSTLTADGGGSGQQVVFTAAGSCSVTQTGTDTTLTIVAAGSCTVRADQDGNANYLPADPVTRSFTVTRATPTLTWPTPDDITYGTALSATQLDAAANVDGSYAYTVDDAAGDPTGRVLGAGAHTLHVTFTPSDGADYTNAVADVSLTIVKARPTLSWVPADPALTYGDALGARQLNAVADVPGSFVYDPAAGSVLHAGTRTLTATFTPDDADDYADGGAVTAAVTVAKAPQTLALADPGQHRYGDAPFTVSATGGASGSPIAFTATGPCTVDTASQPDGTATVTLTGVGACSITASQAGSADYLAAQDATRSVTVAKGTPTITWPTPADVVYRTTLGGAQFNATASVPGRFAYTVDGRAYTSGTVLHAGNHRLAAVFTPSDTTRYTTAAAAVTLVVRPAPQSVTLAQPADTVYGVAPFKVALSGTASGRPITVKPDTGSPCSTSSVTSSSVTVGVTGAGTCGLTAIQSGSADYAASAAVHVSFAVDRKQGKVTIAPIGARIVGAAPVTVQASGSKTTTPVLLSAGPEQVCSLSGTRLSITGVGTCSVRADQAGDANYYAAPTVTIRFPVSYKIKALSGQGTVKAGTSLLVRVQLTNSGGGNLSAAAIPVQALALDSTPLSAAFAFSSVSGGAYDYRVDTTGLTPGGHALTFTAGDDPVLHLVTFTVK